MTSFTVVIPSHSHGRLLELSAASALRQSVDDIEVFIVLDGADGPTREAAERLLRTDDRVRVFDNPKGERVGEAHRDVALESARGRFVAYLSDDDLWLPHHLEHIAESLESVDFVAAQSVFHGLDGHVSILPGDLADPVFRRRLLSDPLWNFFGLSQGSHTMEAYRSLDRGWHPAPHGLWADLHMWRHFLRHPDLTAVSATETTVFTFPSRLRRQMTVDERVEETLPWAELTQAPARLSRFLHHTVGPEVRGTAAREAARRIELETELAAIRSSLAYRASRRIASMPIVGRLGRRMARWIARDRPTPGAVE